MVFVLGEPFQQMFNGSLYRTSDVSLTNTLLFSLCYTAAIFVMLLCLTSSQCSSALWCENLFRSGRFRLQAGKDGFQFRYELCVKNASFLHNNGDKIFLPESKPMGIITLKSQKKFATFKSLFAAHGEDAKLHTRKMFVTMAVSPDKRFARLKQ